MKITSQGFRGRARLISGWVAVLLYLGALTPTGPLFTALLGRLDPDHQLQVGASDEGISVVLHHCAECSRGHHHGLIARTLTVFAEPAGQDNPDHIVQFHASVTSPKENGVAVISKNLAHAQFALAPPATALPLLSTMPVRMVSRPPPDLPASLDSLRSIVLLI